MIQLNTYAIILRWNLEVIFINKYLIDLKLNDFKINCYGNIDNNKILFIHNNINYTFDIDKTILIKEDNNYLFTFLFKNNILILHDKIQNKDINISLLINKLEIFEKKIIINYQIEDDRFNLTLTYTEGGNYGHWKRIKNSYKK